MKRTVLVLAITIMALASFWLSRGPHFDQLHMGAYQVYYQQKDWKKAELEQLVTYISAQQIFKPLPFLLRREANGHIMLVIGTSCRSNDDSPSCQLRKNDIALQLQEHVFLGQTVLVDFNPNLEQNAVMQAYLKP